MKKVLLGCLIVLGFSALMAGCGSDSRDQQPTASRTTPGETPAKAQEKKLTIGIVFDKGGRGDKSFNDSAYRGIERGIKEFGIEAHPVESKSEKDYETNLAALAEKNCDLVFAIGINMKTALEASAKKYPNIKFAIVDADVNLPNVRSLLFKEEEGSFLVGYLAGEMSKSKKIGFIGGMEIPLIKKFQAGYEAGAKTADPSIEVLPAKYTGNWDDVSTAKAAANLLYSQGADVIYHAAGRAGLGVLGAAKEQNKLAIGVDSDQDYLYPGFVLTSMVKRVDEAVFQTIKDLKDNQFGPGKKIYDLKAGGVGFSELKYTRDKIGVDKLKKLDEIKQKIVEGQVQVPADPESLKTFLSKK